MENRWEGRTRPDAQPVNLVKWYPDTVQRLASI